MENGNEGANQTGKIPIIRQEKKRQLKRGTNHIIIRVFIQGETWAFMIFLYFFNYFFWLRVKRHLSLGKGVVIRKERGCASKYERQSSG